MAKVRHHHLDIYDSWLHLATSNKAWRKLGRQHPSLEADTPDSQGEVHLTVETTDNGKHVAHLSIWLNPAATNDQRELVDLIAHEAAHAAGALLDHIGQEYDGKSEALAYLVGFISGWLWDGCTS